MARELDARTVLAIRKADPGDFSIGNTMVSVEKNGVIRVYLHGNLIAHRTNPPQPHFTTQQVAVPGETMERWEMSMCGWPADLTRRRLNVICNELFGRRPFAQINKLQWFLREPASPHPPVDGKDIYILSDTIVVLHILRRQSPLKPTVIVEIDKEIV
jgi:hypothetical protein